MSPNAYGFYKTKASAVLRTLLLAFAFVLLFFYAGESLAEKNITPPDAEKPNADAGQPAQPDEKDSNIQAGKGANQSKDKTQEEQEQAEQTPAPEKPANYLLLVNWDHAYDGEEFTLVRLDKVFDRDLVIKSNHHLIEKTTGEAANSMFRAAKEQGIGKFVIDNVYRSPARQTAMWNKSIRKNADYGANPYSKPVKVLPGGKSEHGTGLALDIFAKTYQKSNAGFADTTEGKWLANNAHLYGFILRYPANKQHITGVIYEPWHFRYVGIAHAAEIYEKGLCLEEYVNLKEKAVS